MARITSDYDSHTKDELLSEAQSRNIEGVNSSMLKADIVAELELSDDQPKSPLPKMKASTIPQIPKIEETELPRIPGDQPRDEEYTDGEFVEVSSGEPYALAIVDDALARDGKTHFAKNSAHFWNGTEAQFREQFDKK